MRYTRAFSRFFVFEYLHKVNKSHGSDIGWKPGKVRDCFVMLPWVFFCCGGAVDFFVGGGAGWG